VEDLFLWDFFLGAFAKNRRRSREVMMPLMFQSTFVSEFLIQIATQQSSYMRENPKRDKVIEGFHCPFKNIYIS
jgi:hypothetical protein